MPLITMTETALGYDDGKTGITYEKGKTYEVGSSLANTFVKSKQASPVKETKEGK